MTKDDDDAVCRTCGDGLAIDDDELEENGDSEEKGAADGDV